MNGPELAGAAKESARRNGFDLAAIASPGLEVPYRRYRDWIAKGYAGEMAYLTRNPEIRRDIRNVWPETKSVLVTGMLYRPPESAPGGAARPGNLPGTIASYALGGDYHKFIKKRLIRILRDLQKIDGGIEGRSYVDTGPILERDLGVLSGLGWTGKNSLLLNRRLGSYFFTGTLLLNRAIPPDPPMEKDHCGTCVKCIEDCPTNAIVAPGVVDSRLCISYLTIELRGPMPRELRHMVGGHVFGCDICQAVCPWNTKAPAATEPRFAPRPGATSPNLHELIMLTEEGFRTRFRGMAIMRARYEGFLRNVAVAIGNTGGENSIYFLSQALHRSEPLVRGHAAWALGQIGGRRHLDRVRRVLETRLYTERDEWVKEEIELALGTAILAINHSGWEAK